MKILETSTNSDTIQHMEDLNRTQIILLTLLLSFVTSIATGIVTVSLLDEAPNEVTQTINRVVERTIEKVVTAPPTKQTQTASIVTRETVVVREEDQVINAISQSLSSIVRIRGREFEDEPETVRSIGIIVSTEGLIMSDANGLPQDVTYRALLSDGTLQPIKILSANLKSAVAFLQIKRNPQEPDGDKPQTEIKFTPTVFTNSPVKLGQSVIAIGGLAKNRITTGIVSSLDEREIAPEKSEGSATTTEAVPPKKVLELISTTVDGSTIVSGSPLLNLSGELVGMRFGFSEDRSVFVPADKLSAALDSFLKATGTPSTTEKPPLTP